MRYGHLALAIYSLAAMALFLWFAAETGHHFFTALAGWFLYWGAKSTCALKRRGLRA